ncbi:MAG: hypothetical protein GX542_08855 [Rhodococcus sp.]|nr:hypothetical protein [Rhodococcus sp. (in: high G+C Gram-positive bacteria)]
MGRDAGLVVEGRFLVGLVFARLAFARLVSACLDCAQVAAIFVVDPRPPVRAAPQWRPGRLVAVVVYLAPRLVAAHRCLAAAVNRDAAVDRRVLAVWDYPRVVLAVDVDSSRQLPIENRFLEKSGSRGARFSVIPAH